MWHAVPRESVYRSVLTVGTGSLLRSFKYLGFPETGRISVQDRRTTNLPIAPALEKGLEKAARTMNSGSKLSQQLVILVRFILVPVFVANLMVTLPAVPQEADAVGKALGEKVPPLLRKALVPGISIAVLDNGRVIWQGCFGVKNADTGEPVKDDTVFEAASLSKPVFAYGVMKLVDQKKLDLDKPLAELISEADLNSAYPPTKGGDLRYKKITPRMVLTHCTGFPNWFSGRPMSFLFDPGERFSYSGEAYTFLAVTVQAITGKSFNDFMRTMVFEPLGMKNSSYVWRESYDMQFSASHDILGHRTQRGKSTVPLAGASLYITAADYARFLVALGNGEGLSRETWQEMIRPQIAVRGRDGKGDVNFHWGLGVGVNQTEKGTTLWHWGDNGDFNAYFEMLPGNKRGVVFFMNGANAHALTPVITREVMGLENPAIATAYFRYPTMDSPAMDLARAFQAGGMAQATKTAVTLMPGRADWESPAGQRFFSLARIALSQGDFTGARTAVELYMQHFPDNPQAMVMMAGIKIAEGDRAAMTELLDKALKVGPQLESAINTLGYALLGAGRFEEAIAIFAYNAERFPKSANCLDSLAEAWLKRGDRDKAVEFYRKALEIDPRLSSAIDALKRLEVKK
jgi:CubicO group peptidase (beta-lactamase class C family)